MRSAHRDATLRKARPFDEQFAERIETFTDALLVVLDRAEATYGEIISMLEQALSSEATRPDIKMVAKHLAPGATALSQLFDRVPVSWLADLRDEGIFSAPPGRRTYPDGSFSFARWPQCDYLARAAAEEPALVAETIVQIPLVDNPVIHSSLLQIATELPIDQAAIVASYEETWLQRQDYFDSVLAEAAVRLASHLRGTRAELASRLLRRVLSFRSSDEDHPWRTRACKLDSWFYSTVVSEGVAPLAQSHPEVAKELLAGLIADAHRPSSVWRSAIEDHRQNQVRDNADYLFEALRDLYVSEVRKEPELLVARVHELEGTGRPLYARLALHLLRLFGHHRPREVVARATNQEFLDNLECFHELAEMISAQFPKLEEEHQGEVLRALKENASIQHLRARDPNASQSELERRSALDRRRWWAVLGSALPAELEEEYGELSAEFGSLEHPTFLSWTGRVQVGPVSPVGAETLVESSDEEIFAWLASTVAERDPFEPSSLGLSREVQKAAERDPARFSRLAPRLRGSSAEYVAAVLTGVREGIASIQTADKIGWDSLLELVEWAINAPLPAGREDDDPSRWGWPRRESVELLAECIRKHSSHAMRAWALLRTLLADPDPTPERLASSNMDDGMMCINSVRGTALDRLLDIASQVGDPAELVNGLKDSILERARTETSSAVLWAVARRFVPLVKLDESLAREVADAVFAVDGSRGTGAVWQHFLRWNDGWPALYRLLKPHYQAAVGSDVLEAGESLGEHLLRLVVIGTIDVDEAIVREFHRHADAEVRYRVLNWLGRALHRDSEPQLRPPVRANFVSLWESWSRAASDSATELRAFGWWFSSDEFDEAWKLRYLRDALRQAGGAIDRDDAVAKGLADLASDHPADVLECLAAFVDVVDDWRVRRSSNAIHEALERLIRSTETADLARQLASRLVARDHGEFYDLAVAPSTFESLPESVISQVLAEQARQAVSKLKGVDEAELDTVTDLPVSEVFTVDIAVLDRRTSELIAVFEVLPVGAPPGKARRRIEQVRAELRKAIPEPDGLPLIGLAVAVSARRVLEALSSDGVPTIPFPG